MRHVCRVLKFEISVIKSLVFAVLPKLVRSIAYDISHTRNSFARVFSVKSPKTAKRKKFGILKCSITLVAVSLIARDGDVIPSTHSSVLAER